MSIGNSPETGRPTADKGLSTAEDDRMPDEEDRWSADDERSATQDVQSEKELRSGKARSAEVPDHQPDSPAGAAADPGGPHLLDGAADEEPEATGNPLLVDDVLLAGEDPLLATDDALLADDDPLGIGHALRQARLDAGLTVDDISTATRVRIPIVHAIEQDDFSRCGGDVYARGHIKTLARAVGLDPEPLLAQFDAEYGEKNAPTPATPLFEAERIRPERRRPNWTAAMVAAIVAVVGFVGFTFFHGNSASDGSTTGAVQGANPAATNPTPKPSHTRSTAPRPDPSDGPIAAAPHDKVTVTVSAGGRSWISAKDHNGQLLFDGFLQKGDEKTFQDNQKIDLVLGNASSLQLFVNGKKIENDFQPGSVQRVSYTKGDPEVG